MLTKEDIIPLELTSIQPPRLLPLYAQYKSSASTRRFVALGDAVAKALTGITAEDVDAQLDAARSENANLIGWVPEEGRTTVHFLGSVISPANGVLGRNIIVPNYYLTDTSRINRVFVAYFLRQSPMDETIKIDVAGWVDAKTVVTDMLACDSPASFASSLRVSTVPVSSLFPISTLPKLDFDFVF